MKTLALVTVLLAGVAVFAQTPQTAGNIENGKKLFNRDGCWECHGYAGQGGRDGARLAETALTTAQFTRYIRRPTGAMPAYIDKVVSDADAADLWAYVRSLTGPKAAKDVPLLTELKGQ
jgi:mono/diheme cytochrome c family protein